MLQELPRNIKNTLAIIAFVIFVSIGYGIYHFITTTGKVEFEIIAVPSDAHITIGGSTFGAGKNYIKAGKYEVKATKEGFASYTTTQQIDKNNATVLISLGPISNDAKKWANEHEQDYQKIEGSAGTIAANESEIWRNKNPIVNVLPISNFIYTIGYKNDPSDSSGDGIIITIDAAEGNRNGAVRAIRDLGYDPTQFKIEFKNYENPFAS